MKRRDFIYGLGSSIGAVAFSALVACERKRLQESKELVNGARAAMFQPKAKACIFLMMEGGPSHIDTFDPKPELKKYHLTQFKRSGKQFSAMSSGNRYLVQSPFGSRKVGQAGLDMSEPFVHLAEVADELCYFRGCQAESVNHPTAMYHMNTGNRQAGDPSLGAWVSYGLGSVNENLPSFIVLPEVAYPQGGPSNWSNGFLPAQYQGTPLRPKGSPILNLEPLPGISSNHQRKSLDLLNKLNKAHAGQHPHHDDLQARMQNYELAFRMQMEVPEIMNTEDEPEYIRQLYGMDKQHSAHFGKKCLLARKLIEKGVRFVQLYSGGWDSHDFLKRAHGNLISSIDKPIAGLIKDLKQRGMLDETLIVWCGEFGRSPDNGMREGGIAYGRDHNPNAMAMWLAGGGVKAGSIIGATDELGASAVEHVHPIRDLHVTLLHLLGLNDHKLTYFHGGRFKQLSQFGGEVIEDILV